MRGLVKSEIDIGHCLRSTGDGKTEKLYTLSYSLQGDISPTSGYGFSLYELELEYKALVAKLRASEKKLLDLHMSQISLLLNEIAEITAGE